MAASRNYPFVLPSMTGSHEGVMMQSVLASHAATDIP